MCIRDSLLPVIADKLRWAAQQAQQAGVTLLVEPINLRDMPHYFLNRQDHAHEILAAVNAPNLQVQMDLYLSLIHIEVCIRDRLAPDASTAPPSCGWESRWPHPAQTDQSPSAPGSTRQRAATSRWPWRRPGARVHDAAASTPTHRYAMAAISRSACSNTSGACPPEIR